MAITSPSSVAKSLTVLSLLYGIKLWQIAANKHFGGQNIGGRLAALHSKIARIKLLMDKTLTDWLRTAESAKVFYRQSFVLYSIPQIPFYNKLTITSS